MKLFGIEFGRKAITAADVRAELLGLGTSKSGAKVSWKTALEVTTAFACARVIADGLAQVPFKLYREVNGNRTPATDHPLYTLLTAAPNDWQTSYEQREQLALHLVFCGDAFIWKNQVGNRIVELLPYEPNAVTVKRDGWAIGYEVATAQGNRVPIQAADMWHIRGPSWNGVTGLQSVKLAREAIGLALATEEHGARMFSNGAKVGGLLSTDSNLNDEQRKALRTSWQETHGGNENAYKTAVLWGGMKWTPMAMQNDQAQLIEQRRFQVDRKSVV